MKIMIVDDELVVGDFFCQLAKIRGYTDIETVGSGQEAISRVMNNRYDLITLDIRMPGLSGLEIIAMLRNMSPHAIIAIISGFIPDRISSEVAECADIMLPKPVDIDTFNTLLDCAQQICDAISSLRGVGIDPSARMSG